MFMYITYNRKTDRCSVVECSCFLCHPSPPPPPQHTHTFKDLDSIWPHVSKQIEPHEPPKNLLDPCPFQSKVLLISGINGSPPHF